MAGVNMEAGSLVAIVTRETPNLMVKHGSDLWSQLGRSSQQPRHTKRLRQCVRLMQLDGWKVNIRPVLVKLFFARYVFVGAANANGPSMA